MEAFTDRKWKHGNTAENLFAAIKHGYPEEGMPAFEQTFNDQEITALVAYIQEGIQNVKQYDFSEETKAAAVYTSESLSYRVDTIATGMEIPWGMAFLPNGDMLNTDRNGAFYRLP